MSVIIFILFHLLFINVVSGCQYKFRVKTSYENGVNVTVLYPHNGTDNYEDRWIARAAYNASYKTVGWDFLEIRTNPVYEDSLQAYAAGYSEGVFNQPIYALWYNTIRTICINDQEKCDKINTFLDVNIIWVKQMIKKYAATNSIWHQVSLFYRQIDGIYDGYTYSNKDHDKNLTMRDFLWINFNWDFEELGEALQPKDKYDIPMQARGLTHCSAIVKLLPNNSDILVAHNTWLPYTTMLRVMKTYILPYRLTEKSHHRVPGQVITFSSYPGVILSGDDYYIINSGLVTLETTHGNSNVSLWEKVKPVGQMFTSVRVMTSNRLAWNGLTWTNTFSYCNSGTNNNEWMVIDYNHFKPGSQPREGTLYILEQIPGYIRSGDQTQVLIDQGYWASYNVPFYPDIFTMSGNDELVKKYGDWFTYDKTPRAQIFKREQSKVKDVNSLMQLMRYNDYKYDPLSRCNCTPPYSAGNAIAARNDLNPANGTYPFPALGHRSYGATDAKVTSFRLALSQQMYAVCGPTTGKSLPNFQWSKTDFNSLPHIMQPDLFNFTYVLHKWNL